MVMITARFVTILGRCAGAGVIFFALAAIAARDVLPSSQGARAEGPADRGERNPAASVLPLIDRARALMQEARYAEAEDAARQALAAAQAGSGPDSIETAEALDVLVEVLWRGGRGMSPDTRSMIERAVAIKEARLGPDDPSLAATLSNVGSALMESGDLNGALPLYERSLTILLKAHGRDDLRVARALNRKAILLRRMGDLPGARPLYEESLAITEKVLGSDHPDVGMLLNGLALLLEKSGDYREARQAYERALGIMLKARGPEHHQVALVKNNLGFALRNVGEYDEARQLLEEALAIRRKVLGPDHPYTATTLYNLARLHYLIGDYLSARTSYEEALRIWKASRGTDAAEVGTCLHDLAQVAEAQQDWSRALALHQEALALRTRLLPEGHEDIALSLNSVARVRSRLNDHAEAVRLYRRALALRERAFDPNHREVAESLQGLAASLAGTGQIQEAGELYRRALTIRQAALGPSHPLVAESLVGLASADARGGDRSAALRAALEAERVAMDHLRLTMRTLSERQSLAYASARIRGLGTALAVALYGPRAAADQEVMIWDAVVRSRAMVLDEMAARQRALAEARTPQMARQAADLQRARDRLAFLTVRGPESAPAAAYRQALGEARARIEELEEEMARGSSGLRKQLESARVGLAEAVGNLPRSSALVAYALFERPQALNETGSANSPSATHGRDDLFYVAFVIRSGERNPRMVPVGPAEAVDQQVRLWRQDVVTLPLGRGTVTSSRTEESAASGVALRRVIWDPLSREVGDAQLVFIVPDGALHLVSFGALPAGREQYLIDEGRRFHYLTAERDLVRGTETSDEGRGLLVVGDLEFNRSGASAERPAEPQPYGVSAAGAGDVDKASSPEATSPCTRLSDIVFGPLPESGREIEDIARIWRRAAGVPPRRDQQEVLRLSGTGATEAAFRKMAAGRRVLHLATHGFYLERSCLSAQEGRRGIGGIAPEASELPAGRDEGSPWRLSGLALSGANRRGQAASGIEDGILTAEEVAGLNLAGVQWVVLSACETAMGHVTAGEGIFGLRRAFQTAGARSVIMSLWAVEDQAASEWMRGLYTARLQEGLGTAEAVYQATIGMLRSRRERGASTNPFFWGGFIAGGDWR